MKDKKVGTALGFVALAVAVLCFLLWFRKVGQVDLPENRTLFVVFFLSAAVLGVSAFVKGTRWFGAIPAVLAIVIGLFLPFTVSISRQEVAAGSIQVGDTIPRFTAIDEHGQKFDSKSLEGHRALIKFFRGYW